MYLWGKPLVLYRDKSGPLALVCAKDVSPHRLASCMSKMNSNGKLQCMQ
jgi:phenylpropionate dioxygenase-like ring-hydroxylating dioxygenase large terminal subunit